MLNKVKNSFNFEKNYISLIYFIISIILTIILGKLFRQNVKMIEKEEIFWTDERIQFWTFIDLFPISNFSDTVTDITDQISVLKQEARKKKIKCVPIEREISVEKIIHKELNLQENQKLLLIDLLIPNQKILVNRCLDTKQEADNKLTINQCFNIEKENVKLKCLPIKDVKQEKKQIKIQIKPKRLITQEMEENIINTTLNGTLNRQEFIIILPIEQHIFCACQCSR